MMLEEPIIVVSGLPRSGTSMMMAMLEAGGISLLTDPIRRADEDNPRGYYEYEPVKALRREGNPAWLEEAKGKTVKIISELVLHLPSDYQYRIILMNRDLREVIASQDRMLARRGKLEEAARDDELREAFHRHLRKVKAWIKEHPNSAAMEVHYRETLDQPVAQAERIQEFLDKKLNIAKMAGVVDKELYRNRL